MTTSLSQTVVQAFRMYLGRDPESDDVIANFEKIGSVNGINHAISTSKEAINYRPKLIDSFIEKIPDYRTCFLNFSSVFDAEATIRRHQRASAHNDHSYILNFIGAKYEERYNPSILNGRGSTVDPLPIPSNWHADVAEWAAVLRSVELAQESFVVAELGCGWGCWITNAGVAARNYGLVPFLIGVEGDEGHIEFAKSCCSLNEFRADQIRLHRGVAAAYGGTALFPKQEHAGEMWGLQPIFTTEAPQTAEIISTGIYDELRMISLEEVIGDHRRLDLLHVDIQGGEQNLVEERNALMAERVAYMFIGTHSRAIEGKIISTLIGGPWRLEIERPAIVSLTPDGPVTHVDGVQGWRNMNLVPNLY